jgi:predicted house-cleaning noncanonical NTP pyrophosphatase (MazG superfamily)
MIFIPINAVNFIEEKGLNVIPPSQITVSLVGEKAYGLSSIPHNWTLPYIVVSSDFIKCDIAESKKWISIIRSVSLDIFERNENIIIRSSSSSEGLSERGQLFSISGSIDNLEALLKNYLIRAHTEGINKKQNMPLIIQKHILANSSFGHLSNERRMSEHKRDWVGEFEDELKPEDKHFKIPLRTWREQINFNEYLNCKLICASKNSIKEVLKIPATWATHYKLRIHYEWVWDGYFIYIVQADEEHDFEGLDPTKVSLEYNFLDNFAPSILQTLTKEHAKRYSKVNNLFIYKELNLPTAPLYILENKTTLKEIINNQFSAGLESDLVELIKNPLMVRIDINTTQKEKQLLPREEFRNINNLKNWLIEKTNYFKDKILDDSIDIAFLFHNFIPAASSAFAYANPSNRNVMIEAFWGLPEGLYYNSHDKYVVDTKSITINSNLDNYVSTGKKSYKKYFVTSDNQGVWGTKELEVPFDWKFTIPENSLWLKEIALQSKMIANYVNKPLSIMWFIDVPKEVCSNQILPWHHEEFDIDLVSTSKKSRKKTTFDKSFIINTSEQLIQLEKEMKENPLKVKRIHIQPMEDVLLRDKNILETIGLLAKSNDAVILLEGSVLSHAFYQLAKTGAQVEIYHPFDEFEDKQEFNKLVRDKIPEFIEEGGEVVNIVKLEKESIVLALKDKLIEESFEVFDSNDENELLSELADVSEVVDAMLHHLGIEKESLLQRQEKKRSKVGGFLEGKILLDTENPLPNTIEEKEIPNLFSALENKIKEIKYSAIPKKLMTNKYKDIQKLFDNERYIARITIPISLHKWKTNLMEIEINDELKLEVYLENERDGSFNNF